jgi:hypothetical protein
MDFKKIVEDNLHRFGYTASKEEIGIMVEAYREYKKELESGDEDATETLELFGGDIELLLADCATFQALLYGLEESGKIVIDNGECEDGIFW